MTYTEFMKLAKANYTKGGDSYYECWDERTFSDYEEMFGKMTKKRALEMFKDNAGIEAEYEAAAEWFGGMDQETINKENEQYEARKKAEEEKTMKKAQVEITVIEVEGVIYTQTRAGYYYKKTEDGQKRIPKAEWEQAFDAYVNTVDGADEEWDSENEIVIRKEIEEKKDKETEDNFNKKVSKPRRSKDVAFEMDTIEGHITLTKKQVDFMKLLPTVTFWEDGIESTLWCDCIADDIQWNPMSVGAMISTLREKKLITVGKDTSRKGHPKYMQFTVVGQVIAKKLGLN